MPTDEIRPPAEETRNDEVTKVAPPPTEPAPDPWPKDDALEKELEQAKAMVASLEERVAKLTADNAYLEAAAIARPTMHTGLVVRANTVDQGHGFSAFFEKPASGETPASVEFSYCGTGTFQVQAVTSLCEGLADCLRARDKRLDALETAHDDFAMPDREKPRSLGMVVDPAAPPGDFDKQIEAVRSRHIELMAQR